MKYVFSFVFAALLSSAGFANPIIDKIQVGEPGSINKESSGWNFEVIIARYSNGEIYLIGFNGGTWTPQKGGTIDVSNVIEMKDVISTEMRPTPKGNRLIIGFANVDNATPRSTHSRAIYPSTVEIEMARAEDGRPSLRGKVLLRQVDRNTQTLNSRGSIEQGGRHHLSVPPEQARSLLPYHGNGANDSLAPTLTRTEFNPVAEAQTMGQFLRTLELKLAEFRGTEDKKHAKTLAKELRAGLINLSQGLASQRYAMTNGEYESIRGRLDILLVESLIPTTAGKLEMRHIPVVTSVAKWAAERIENFRIFEADETVRVLKHFMGSSPNRDNLRLIEAVAQAQGLNKYDVHQAVKGWITFNESLHALIFLAQALKATEFNKSGTIIRLHNLEEIYLAIKSKDQLKVAEMYLHEAIVHRDSSRLTQNLENIRRPVMSCRKLTI